MRLRARAADATVAPRRVGRPRRRYIECVLRASCYTCYTCYTCSPSSLQLLSCSSTLRSSYRILHQDFRRRCVASRQPRAKKRTDATLRCNTGFTRGDTCQHSAHLPLLLIRIRMRRSERTCTRTRAGNA
ncbi:hypothetical protein V9T40_008280 [Parthenolecanium corni]|uniref:Uncharacterized protein n=1 Tax=Parthenolecanium corni TaxID=536013 RepID=A0AAN9TY62_9HEMI